MPGWIKICGIKDVETARAVACLEPNAIGLNFYAKTPRQVEISVAKQIVQELPDGVEPVGLFVNHQMSEVAAISDETGIRAIQLQGDETAADLANLYRMRSELKLIRAYRMGPDGLDGLAEYLDQCGELGVDLSAILLDARVSGAYGGTGTTLCWDQVFQEYPVDEWPPLVLAGGLTPANVEEAITTTKPWGIDVSSGVESTPAVKDLGTVQEFMEACRRAFDRG